MFADFTDAAVVAGTFVLGGAATWLVRLTSTKKDVEAVTVTLETVARDHKNRLDSHDEELRRITTEFVSRRELDEKLKLILEPLQRQIEQQTRMLEFAVFGKMPEPPVGKI